MSNTNNNTNTDVERITITLPDDFHHHFRDGVKTAHVVSHAVERFGRCIAMPNTKPPITSAAMASDYRDHILSCRPDDCPETSMITPLMTLYLTDHTTPEDVAEAHATGFVPAAKYYPAGATTNSSHGVTDPRKVMPALRRMAELGMLLLVHSEITHLRGEEVDVFDRERLFVEHVMEPILTEVGPTLRVVMEHISTKEAVEYVRSKPLDDTVCRLRATITAHHLLYNRNRLLAGGIRPHLYCLPILKREEHRLALLGAATSGDERFFAGTDSAPHTTADKESACGCAGVYTAHAAVELYAEAFGAVGKLDKLENFTSVYGARFYGLPRNERTITLEHRPWTVPKSYKFGAEDDQDTITPLRAGETLQWRIV